MSYSDPTHWRRLAEESRVVAEHMNESVSRQVMRRFAESYEALAKTAEQRAKNSQPNPVLETLAVPAVVRQFGRKKSFGAPPASVPNLEIPSFLKRGPAVGGRAGDDSGAAEARSVITAESAPEKATAMPRSPSQDLDDVAASISALEAALGLPPKE
jgi:hypothetical protein